ncbi:MAG: hypothetical protein PHE52_02225 [Candidatus Pacebacteria bacterium]|nr:hypothetical protein [Candidatus Paceibacterota bacterium]
MLPHFRKLKKNSNFQNILFAVIVVIFLLGTVSFLVISNWRINQKRADLTTQIKELEKEIQAFEEKNQQLKAGIIQTEDETYWEGKLREQGYKKPGEEAVVVLPAEENNPTSTEKEKSLWQVFLEKLGF